MAEKIIDLILEDPEIKMSEVAEKLEVTTRTIEREMKKLRESGRVIRVGGKRYGHKLYFYKRNGRWEVLVNI